MWYKSGAYPDRDRCPSGNFPSGAKRTGACSSQISPSSITKTSVSIDTLDSKTDQSRCRWSVLVCLRSISDSRWLWIWIHGSCRRQSIETYWFQPGTTTDWPYSIRWHAGLVHCTSLSSLNRPWSDEFCPLIIEMLTPVCVCVCVREDDVFWLRKQRNCLFWWTNRSFRWWVIRVSMPLTFKSISKQ